MKRRKLRFKSLSEVAPEAWRLHYGGYHQVGAWSLGQICSHLNTFMIASLDGFNGLKAPRLLRAAIVLVKPIALRVNFMPRGIEAPAFMQPPAVSAEDEHRAIEAVGDTIARVLDPAATFHPSPLLGRLSADQWRRLHCVHAAHHLGFLVSRSAPQKK